MNRSLCADWDNVQSTSNVKEARLEDRIGELEKENAERVSVTEGENVGLLEQSSTSHASQFLTIPRGLYERWILVEAQFEVVQELGQTGFVYEIASN